MRALATLALATTLIVPTAAIASPAAPVAPGAADPDATVRLAGPLVRLSNHGGPQQAAVQRGNQLVPVDAAAVDGIPDGSRVTLEVTVPDRVQSAAAKGDDLTVRGFAGRSETFALDPGDLAEAADSTPSPLGSQIGQATVASALAPSSDPLEVAAVLGTAPPTASAIPSGPRTVHVVTVSPTGSPVPGTHLADWDDDITKSNGLWRASSDNQVGMVRGTVHPSYTTSASCNDMEIFNEAAARLGFGAGLYQYPTNQTLALRLVGFTGCYGVGLGTVGSGPDSGGIVWTDNDNYATLAHEVGHNMSMGHANALACDGPLGDDEYSDSGWASCNELSYYDGQDVMSSSYWVEGTALLSTPQSVRTGLLPAASVRTLGLGSAQAVTLTARSQGSGLRSLKVVNPADGVTYWVEYRPAVGYDAINTWQRAPGVRVLRSRTDSYGSEETILLDPTPTGYPDPEMTVTQASPFVSYDHKVTVRLVSTTATTATLSVDVLSSPPLTVGSRPTITGTAAFNELLTANPGTYVPAATSHTYQWRRNGAAIPDATGQYYYVQEADGGTRITVSVSGAAPGYARTTATSDPLDVPLGTVTVHQTPSIYGTPRPGSILRSVDPDTTPFGVGLSYQWRRDGAAISGATGQTYQLTTADAGRKITLAVRVAPQGYAPITTVSNTVTVEQALTATTRPVITGTVKVGSPLRVSTGTWSSTPTYYQVQWRRNGTPITGATSWGYTPVAGDAGATLTATVTAATSTSSGSSTTAGATVARGTFTVSVAPTISGTRAVGKILTARPGTWSPSATYSYQWKRNGVAISGATQSTYTVRTADAGRSLTVTVTARRTGYSTSSRTTAKAGIPIYPTTRPKITGTAKVGRTLTAYRGVWTPTPSTYSYQWYRGTTAIYRATGQKYVLRSTDAGKKIRVKVTVRRSGYVTGSAYTAYTASVLR